MPKAKKTFYETVWADCVQPVYESLRGKETARLQKQIQTTQWASIEELNSMQASALERLLAHAAASVPFYREWFIKNQTTAKDLISNEGLSALPMVDRDMLVGEPDRFRSETPPRGSFFKSTGGTTGAPLTFGVSPLSSQWRMAVSRRGYEWAECFPGRRQIHLWSSDVLHVPLLKKAKKNLHRRLMNQMYVSSFDMLDSEGTARVLRMMQKFKPRCIVAYPSSAAILAQYMLDHKERIESGLLSCIGGGEALFDSQREIIEKAFGCPCFETYGNREFMLIAAECDRHNGLHISAENLVVEILKDGKPAMPGETGEIIITDLHNYAQPFIRYRTGDLSSLVDGCCSCGRALPRLAKIEGRRLDMIKGPDGRLLSGHFLPHFVQDFPQIERFQIVQDATDHVIIRLVLKNPLPDTTRALMISKTEEKLPGVKCEVQYVDAIEMTPGGKHRTTIGLSDD